MPAWVGVGGVPKALVGGAVGVGGVAKTLIAGWVGDGSGVAKQFFSSGAVVAISNQTISDTGANNPAAAGYSLTNGGDVQTRVNFSATTVGQWITPASGMSGYEARATVTGGGGGTLSGTVGSWLNLGSSQTWELSSAVSGALVSRTLTIEIRDTATSTVQATATITLNVEAI